jgi:hypothetical protein
MSLLVRVTWRDAHFDPEQLTRDEFKDDYRVQTVGWVTRDTEEWLSVSQEVLPDEDGFRGTTHIPRPLVLAIESLTVTSV